MKSLDIQIKEIEDSEDQLKYANRIIDYTEKSFMGGGVVENALATGSEVWDSELNAFLDASTLKSLFFSEDWVYIICDLIANKISSQQLRVMKEEIGDDGNVTTSFDDQHPINSLLDRPNEWQDYHSWMYNVCVEYFLQGNSIIWYAKQKGNLIVFPTELVTMEFNDSGGLKSYMVATSTEEMKVASQVARISFDPKEIDHIRRPNPSSLLWGLSPFVPGRKSILFNRYSQDYLNQFYQRQATPGLALKMDKNVNEDVALRQLRSFELAYTGRSNARRTMIVPKGVDVQTLSHSISDQKLQDLIDMNRETICALLKVPKHELSLQTAGSLGSEEYKTSIRNFWEATLKPAMRMIEGSLTNFFKNELGPGRFLEFDLSGIESLQDDKSEQADLATKLLNAGWSVNEVRQEVYEKAPSREADADTPFNLIGKSAALNPFLPFSTQAPQQATLTEATEVDEETHSAVVTAAKVQSYIAKHDGYLDTVKKQLDEQESSQGGKIQELVLDIFLEFAVKAVTVARQTLQEKSLVSKQTEIPSKSTFRRRLQRSFDDLEEQWVSKYVEILESSIETGYDTQLTVGFNKTDKDEIFALRARDADDRKRLLTDRGIESFAKISATHSDRILTQIANGVSKNETIDQIADRIAETFRDPDAVMGKARTIARTETLTAVSIGQAAAVQNAKEILGDGLLKAWITADDERVRDSHDLAQADGAIPVDKDFSNGLGHPRELGAPAEEVINCRCTLVMIPPGTDFDEI